MKSLLLFLLLLPVFVSGQVIETIAGNGVAGYSGDGGAAIFAKFNWPNTVKFDRFGNMYISDWRNNVIRKINTTGIITTVAGNGYGAGIIGVGGYTGDGGSATDAELNGPVDIAFDADGNMYFNDQGSVIRKISNSGIISTIAGTGVNGYNGDGIPATAAELNSDVGIVFDNAGNLYFSDESSHRVRKINALGIISTVAGTGTAGYNVDNIAATVAQLSSPCFLAIDSVGNLYITEHGNHRVRRVDNIGIITTVAGNGVPGNSGDGGPATAANISAPEAIVFDVLGNFYISDGISCTIRKVTPSGIITTILGNDTCGYKGDGGSATNAEINIEALCTAVDPFGDLYIADYENSRIRRVVYDETEVNTINKTANSITIYPNPALTEVTIKSTTAIESVEVVNMMGQVVTSPRPSPKEREVLLDVRSLPAGVYFVKVNGVYGGRFVKE